MDFVPLDVTTTYSLLASTIRPAALVMAAQAAGYAAVAMADDRVLYGAYDLVQAAQAAGLNPLVGAKFTLAVAPGAAETLRVTVYAKDATGYAHLMQLSTLAMTRAATDPLTPAELTARLTGLALVVNPQLSLVTPLSAATQDLLRTLAAPADRYLGINLDFNADERAALQAVSDQVGLPLIAFEPVQYLTPQDYFPTQVLRAVKAGHQLPDPLTAAQQAGEHWLRPAGVAAQRYVAAGLTAAAARTGALAAQCQLTLTKRAPVLPPFPVPTGETAASWLKHQAQAGLAQRPLAPGVKPAAYQQRLAHELTVINELGFADYFLIVSDVMNFAHHHQILTGPGRGSAAGSLVAYALAITDVDPLQYHLLFERFLNPDRAQMPDIDLDLPDTRREEVLAYVHQKYGHQRVAQIITFGSLGAKQVVRDVSRVFGLPAYQADQVSQAVARALTPTAPTLVAASQSQALTNLASDQPLVGLLLRVAQQLEGLPRHASIHAAGIVLSAQPLIKTVPLQTGNDPAGLLVTQFPKGPVEALGLLKMDFLGLRNLTTVARACDLIRAAGDPIDLAKISLADPATLALFQAGDTAGIFQFESRGIRQVLVDLHPDNFEELVAVNALYRPGPLENIPHFIARKQGREPVTIPAPALAPILQPTYGILVYQEQVMQVAVVMANFTLGEADQLRRAMSKKQVAAMAAMRAKFMAGAQANGYSAAVATQVFDYIDQFAHYGFNRSHAVAYSKMAFQMAYLKAHYPAAFLTAVMLTEPDRQKVWEAFFAARQRGVATHGPAINHSTVEVSLQGADLYVGFDQIRGLRQDFAQAIVAERTAHGPFANLPDFINRLPSQWQQESLIKPLILAGAFDRLGYNRAEMVASLPALIEGAGLSTLDPSLAPVIATKNEFSLAQRLDQERAVLGTYLSGHPTSQYADLRVQLQAPLIKDLQPGQRTTIIGLVNRVRPVKTKKATGQWPF